MAWVQDNTTDSGVRWVQDTPSTYDSGQSMSANVAGLGSLGGLENMFIGPIQTAFAAAGRPDYGGQDAHKLIADNWGELSNIISRSTNPSNDVFNFANSVLQKAGMRPFASVDEYSAANSSLPGHNESLSDLSGFADIPGELLSEPGFRALALTAAGGSLLGPGTTPAVAAPAAADAGLAGLIESGAVGTAGGALEAGALTGGVDYASLLAGTAPSSVATTGGIAAAAGLSPEVLRLLGIAGVTGLGMYGANKQADSLRDIAAASEAKRAPFYNKSIEYLNNPEAYISGPGKSSLDATLRALSARHGNPIGSPTALGIATEAGLRDWRDAVTGFGNMGLSGEDARMNIQGQATGADANVLNALGYGLGQVTNPQTTLEQLLRGMRGGSLSLV
jgi:hypothetical protein